MSELVESHRSHSVNLKTEDGKLFVHTVFNNRKALEQNKMIRSNNFMEKGQLGLHDGADIRFGISVPSNIEWQLFKKKNPNIYKLIKSRDEAERIKGCKQLQFLEPEWIIQHRL